MKPHTFIHRFSNGTRIAYMCVPGERIRKLFYGPPPEEWEMIQYEKRLMRELKATDDAYFHK